MSSLAADLTPENIALEKIFLDPNNPRFVGTDWTFVPDEEVTQLPVQQAARRRLIDHHDVGKLQSVMEANGFLPIDRVVVRKLDENGNYVVLEGNRRICAAKEVTGYYDNGDPIPQEIMDTFQEISCLVYEGNDNSMNAAWILQGLRHVSGISEWPAYNKAKLLVDRMEADNLTLTQVGKSFGLSAHGAGQWVRGYYAFQQAKEVTEVGEHIDEKIYPFFQEIFGRSSIALKEWMRWDDAKNEFQDSAALNEFVGWLFPVDRVEGDSGDSWQDPTKAEVEAAWSNRRITKRDNLREISYMISDAPKEWMSFRSGASLETAYNTAVYNSIEDTHASEKSTEDRFFKIISDALRELNETPISVIMNSEKRAKLLQLTAGVKGAIEKIDDISGKQ
mmetsp:Transcript_3487/g.6213  ORF Transcript_3487/g.6213 Transcript_3487/m.6213 type:complete len:392 (+) Transcript_3487:365-1540(+)